MAKQAEATKPFPPGTRIKVRSTPAMKAWGWVGRLGTVKSSRDGERLIYEVQLEKDSGTVFMGSENLEAA